MIKNVIRPSLLRGRRTWDFRRLDDSWRKNANSAIADQVHLGNLKMQAARVQHYVETFIPEELREKFYNVLEDYAHAHDLIAIAEMRKAIKGNQFAPANDAKAEEGDTAAAITMRVSAMFPSLKGKAFLRKLAEEREKELGPGHGPIDRSTVHRHKQRFGESARKRR